MKFQHDKKYLVLANPQIALQCPHPVFHIGEIVIFKKKIDNIKEDFFIFLFEAVERTDRPQIWMDLKIEEIEPDWSLFFQEIETSDDGSN